MSNSKTKMAADTSHNPGVPSIEPPTRTGILRFLVDLKEQGPPAPDVVHDLMRDVLSRDMFPEAGVLLAHAPGGKGEQRNILLELGALYVTRGNYTAAFEVFREVVRNDPNLGEWDSIEPFCDPDSPLRHVLGLALLCEGRAQHALSEFQIVARSSWGRDVRFSYGTLRDLACAYDQLGDRDKAREAWDQYWRGFAEALTH